MEKKKILKKIMVPSVALAGVSVATALSATSCSDTKVDGGVIDVHWDGNSQQWTNQVRDSFEVVGDDQIAKADETPYQKQISDYTIIVTTIANKRPQGTVRESLRSNILSAGSNVNFNDEAIELFYTYDKYFTGNEGGGVLTTDIDLTVGDNAQTLPNLSLTLKSYTKDNLPDEIVVKCWGTKTYIYKDPQNYLEIDCSFVSWERLNVKFQLNKSAVLP